MIEYVDKNATMDFGTLYDWYISSIDETIPPVWTAEHIEELLNDFLVIPKETPTADVRPERYGQWEVAGDGDVQCSVCEYVVKEESLRNFCPCCGAKMDGGDGKNNAAV